ncbi:MAG TPA: putative Ig domain-containing protein [Trebonia sp.]|jgi:hypothetical protein|nr:putative Ig domain-containing protein [Trebonia sp.]
MRPFSALRATLKAGTHGVSYSTTIPVTGGTKPCTFTAETALPSGLTLNKTTGAVTGKPATKGTCSFVVSISDSLKPARNTSAMYLHLTVS